MDLGPVMSHVNLLEIQILRPQMKNFKVYKKIFVNHLSSKGFIIIIHEEVLKLSRNKTSLKKKNGQIPALGRQRQLDLCEFESSLIYTESSRPARVT